MDTKFATRTAGAISLLVIAAGVAVACSKDDAKDAASSATSAASVASSAVSSGASVASSAVSSVMATGTPTTINTPGLGEVKLDGPVADAYAKAGGEAKLGAPTAQPQNVGDGTVQAFANGSIYYSPSTGAQLVQGEILKVYTAHGGPTGELGFPTADETETGGGPDVAHGGWISEFQKGTITWLNQGEGTFKETITQK